MPRGLATKSVPLALPLRCFLNCAPVQCLVYCYLYGKEDGLLVSGMLITSTISVGKVQQALMPLRRRKHALSELQTVSRRCSSYGWLEEGEWWVALANVSQARQSLAGRAQPGDDRGDHQIRHGRVCTKCDISLDRSKALLFSETELHLELAISSLGYLNNTGFQMQSGELSEWIKELINTAAVPNIQDESPPVEMDEAAGSNEIDGNTAIEPVAENSEPCKDSEKQPSTIAQVDTVEAEVPSESPESTNKQTVVPDSVAHGADLPTTEEGDCYSCSASDESASEVIRQIGDSIAEAQELASDNDEVIDC